MKKRVEVAAGVITRPDGSFLLGQRAPDTFYPGYWEFPGGKVEAGETAEQALVRELDEELGIRVTCIRPWITREHRYEHAHVRLHFFEVTAWDGEINDHVHSALSWEHAGWLGVGPMLPANGPILKALHLPRWMGITHAVDIGTKVQLARLDAALERGLRLVQVREPGMPRDELASFAGAVIRRAREYRALVVINQDSGLAHELGADGVHLPAAELGRTTARPAFEWVGASCHCRAELERAAGLGLDYALLGAVRPTLTHPHRETLGWHAFAELVRDLPIPVLALGGLVEADMEPARSAGAHGIAGIRGVWLQS
ncbi:Nudix family hydrolase [Aromatoleum aromaticum]|uniref:8-oxo-dGTP diphosphatase n=1 Tax=Aromatoleum aromaticum (strain DSM 19018 / LMG 30748 / EbN1) TaxID=76114 RepID=Q5P2L6_AROAE|nr:Nudix family hydrolase [Aromatoleum aromaticum]NMG56367.1 Nudix family hydrolase [Aromatoleum aromaticum]CAI08448.1 NUDIX hydrolase [Aromatoleum aromaticum EbN1]